VKRCDEGLNKL